MSDSRDTFRLPFRITQFGPDMLVALDKNFREIERVFGQLVLYEKLTGKPVNETVDLVTDVYGNLLTSKLNEKLVGLTEELQLNDLAVTNAKLAVAAVLAANIKDGEVVADKIASNAVTTVKLDALAVTAEKIGANAVIAAKIKAGEIVSTHIHVDGLNANTIKTGTLDAARVSIGSTSAFSAGYDPSIKRRVFTATPTTPYDVGDLWADGPTGDFRRCTTARASGDYVVGDWTLASKYTDDTVANVKRRVFTTTPTTPYEIGDLWAEGSTGDMKRCSTTRLTGSYTAGDWTLASKYTDDTTVNTLLGNLKDMAYEDAVEKSKLSLTTIIDGGYLRTGFVDASRIDVGTLNADRIGANSIVAGKLNVTDLAAITGSFSALSAGDSAGARVTLGRTLSPTVPYTRMYDSGNKLRVEGLQDRFNFYSPTEVWGGSVHCYSYEVTAGVFIPAIHLRSDEIANIQSGPWVHDLSTQRVAHISAACEKKRGTTTFNPGISLIARDLAEAHVDHKQVINSSITLDRGISLSSTFTNAFISASSDRTITLNVIKSNPSGSGNNYIELEAFNDGDCAYRLDDTGDFGGASRPALHPTVHDRGFIGLNALAFYRYYVGTGGYQTASSEKLKTNIKKADTKISYDQVKSLSFRNYKHRGAIEVMGNNAPECMGLITEEAPDSITDETKQYISIYPYISLIGAAVQEMQARIERLEEKN